MPTPRTAARCASLALVGAVVLVSNASRAGAPVTPPPLGPVEVPADRAVEVALPDGVVVKLEPGTRGRWLPRSRLPSEKNKYTSGYHLSLASGEIEVKMPDGPRGAHAFLVDTAEGTLTDWRGKLHVRVADGTTAAAIYEGALVVGSNGVGFPVYDGAGILMKKGVDPDKSRAIPPAPTWDLGRAQAASFAVAPTGQAAQLRVAWKPVPGAASYRVVLASDAGLTRILEMASTQDTSFATVERPGGGRSWIAVRAVGAEGIVGEWASPLGMRVVHYNVPDGAVVARDGAIVLRPGQKVALSDAEGLEFSYTSANLRSAASLYWSKLTGPVGFRPDDENGVEDRLVHLRDPSLGGSGILRLAHRQLRADIELTPDAPRPGQPVDVRAQIWDPSGRLDGASEIVHMDATLDIEPLRATWQKTGNVWSAHLQPRVIGVPTVVRVTATDDRGQEIGRGILGIDPPAVAQAR